MTPHRLPAAAGTALVLTTACAAWAWRDCMLLATSGVLAYRLFLLRMDHGTPWRALAAAVDALSAGVLAGGAGLALMAGMAAAQLGWWQPTTARPAATLLILTAAAAWCCLARGSREEALQELRLWLCLIAAAVVAIEAHHSGWLLAPCLFVSAVGMALLWAGWQLATRTASALLRAGSEPR